MILENIIYTKNLIRQVFAIDILKSRTYKNKEITYSVPKDPNYIGKVDLEIDHKHVHALRLLIAHLLHIFFHIYIMIR